MKKLCFIGGDMRQIRVINKMAESGYIVKAFGFDKLVGGKIDPSVKICKSVADGVQGVSAVVLPLPYTLEREMINAPFCNEKIHTGDVLRHMGENTVLLIGKADDSVNAIASLYKVHTVDYFKREELEILNAIPTAEGALEIAMRETPITIHGSKCLILGNGRIGKILGKMLTGIGADVTVCVRKHRDAAIARSNGESVIFFRELAEKIENFDIIFNTVPFCVIDYKVLKRVRQDSLIIDLASKPGGVDFDTANQLDKRVIWALSLPGKVAPHTAGDFIWETILNILEELGV